MLTCFRSSHARSRGYWGESLRFITVREIAVRLMQDAEARKRVGAARDQQEEKRSLE